MTVAAMPISHAGQRHLPELERELRADRKFRQELQIFLDQSHRPGFGVDPLSPRRFV